MSATPERLSEEILPADRGKRKQPHETGVAEPGIGLRFPVGRRSRDHHRQGGRHDSQDARRAKKQSIWNNRDFLAFVKARQSEQGRANRGPGLNSRAPAAGKTVSMPISKPSNLS